MLEANRDRIDLNELKRGEEYYIKIGRRYEKVISEKGIYEVIESIKCGNRDDL